MADFPYRFGIEEELFLADARTRGTPGNKAAAFHKAAARKLERVEPELLQLQVEISSPPSTSFAEARDTLGNLRASLAEIGAQHGISVFAAGTHPVARWRRQTATQAERYQQLMQELGMLGHRNVVCGMHVHVEVPEPERRVEMMNRLLPFMPVLLALSTSSPFWQGRLTGLKGYRLSAFGELPRTGLPDLFADADDYARYVRIMTQAGAVKDASYLWWTIRPSLKYPTLELRVADSCTKLDDAITIAALYRCLVRLVSRRPEINRALSGASRGVVAENLFRAQADGAKAELINEQQERALPFSETLAALLALVAEDAQALGCVKEVEEARSIAERGTSADMQIATFQRHAAGDGEPGSDRDALYAVVDQLSRETANREGR